MTEQPTLPKKKRGAPYGNKNALKHGLYARNLHSEEICQLKNEPLGKLEDEANLMRALILRTTRSLNSDPAITFHDYIYAVRAIIQAVACLTNLARTRKSVYEEGGYTIKDAIDLAMSELNKLPFEVD